MKKPKVEKLPPGICQGAIETYPEKYIRKWPYFSGEFNRDKRIKGFRNFRYGKGWKK